MRRTVLALAASALLLAAIPLPAVAQEHGAAHEHPAAGQVAALEEVRDAMWAEARRLGAEIVRLERELDRTFAAGTVTEVALRETAAAAGEARGRLRAAQLSAHLDTCRILSESQTRRYEELRGYGE